MKKKRKNPNMFDKDDRATWAGNPRDVKARNESEFYEKTPPKRFSVLFMARLLPIYVFLFFAILAGISIQAHGLSFWQGLLFETAIYTKTWLIFSWTLVPTIIWVAIASSISMRNYAKTWYLWTAILQTVCLASIWMALPEYAAWVKLHLMVSAFCHIYIYFHLDITALPRHICKFAYILGGILIVLNLLTFLFV